MQYTVEPLIMDTLKSGQPPYNGHTVHPLPYCPYISTSEEGTTTEQWTICSPLPIYFPYISTSEEGTTSLQWTKCSPPVSIHFYLRRRDNLPTMDKMFTPCLYRFLPPKKGQPPYNGQNVHPQRVHYSEVAQ